MSYYNEMYEGDSVRLRGGTTTMGGGDTGLFQWTGGRTGDRWSLTYAVERLDREEIVAAARHARDGGLTGLKLYGMVGLPQEEDADVEATAELLLALKKATPGLRLENALRAVKHRWFTPPAPRSAHDD